MALNLKIPVRPKSFPLKIQKNIMSCGGSCYVFLKADGTCVAIGGSFGANKITDWTNIVSIDTTGNQTVGIKADGTCVAVGSNNGGQLNNVSNWKDIVAVALTYDYTIGLKANGTCVAVGDNSYGQCNVSNWKNIVAISTGGYYNSTPCDFTIGLKADGTCVVAGTFHENASNATKWKDMIVIKDNAWRVTGLKADGTWVSSDNMDTSVINNLKLKLALPIFNVYGYYQPSTNKLFTVKDGALTAVCNGWSQLVGADKLPYIEQCTEDKATLAQLKPLGDFKLYSFLTEPKTCKVQFTVVEKPVTVKPKTLTSTLGYGTIKKIAMGTSVASMNIKVLCTTDLKNFKYYDTTTGTWKTTTDFSQGMSITAVNAIPEAGVQALLSGVNKIAFGFYFEPTATSATYNFSLGVQGQKDGSWKRAVHGTDYDYGYPFNNTLRVEIKVNGDYKVNYTEV